LSAVIYREPVTEEMLLDALGFGLVEQHQDSGT
jgi:hypothetical protein